MSCEHDWFLAEAVEGPDPCVWCEVAGVVGLICFLHAVQTWMLDEVADTLEEFAWEMYAVGLDKGRAEKPRRVRRPRPRR